MTIKIYEVGGHVRDSFLGIESKDIDMAVEAPSWEAMREHVHKHTKRVFLEKPEFLTIRAMGLDNLPKDFVLCRKDGVYSDGRRPDSVEPGTIFDDLARRDFTVNAIARDTDTGEILDPYDGRKDLEDKVLRCVGNAEERFSEDYLRIVRAIRFSITKDLEPDREIKGILWGDDWVCRDLAKGLASVSRDRVREELHKCFRHDTQRTISFFGSYEVIHPNFVEAIFGDDIWLEPTTKSR